MSSNIFWSLLQFCSKFIYNFWSDIASKLNGNQIPNVNKYRRLLKFCKVYPMNWWNFWWKCLWRKFVISDILFDTIPSSLSICGIFSCSILPKVLEAPSICFGSIPDRVEDNAPRFLCMTSSVNKPIKILTSVGSLKVEWVHIEIYF